MHTVLHKKKLVARIRRVKGQLDAVERALSEERGCEEVVRTIAAARGAMSALAAEVLCGHLDDHVAAPNVPKIARAAAATELAARHSTIRRMTRMREQTAKSQEHIANTTPALSRRERGVQLVGLLTALMMLVEIVAGYTTNSMALLADGWHMATHVGALGLASAAYWVSRRFAEHRAFAFGTGKVHALAGYTSAVTLGLVAVAMMVESVERLFLPHAIDFVGSLPVAVLGLVVNLVSVFLLHAHDDHDHDHDHDHPHDEQHHDHNHRAAFLHVVADTFTSGLAIAALLAGRFLGWSWLDAVSGLIGGLVILHWGAGLSRNAAFELLDVTPSSSLADEIRAALEALDDVRVRDLRVWSLGGGSKGCVVKLATAAARDTSSYREALARFEFAHLTVEVQQRPARREAEARAMIPSVGTE